MEATSGTQKFHPCVHLIEKVGAYRFVLLYLARTEKATEILLNSAASVPSWRPMSRFFHNAVRSFTWFFGFVFDLTVDGLRFLCLTVRSRPALGAEVLFLRQQLAFYVVVVTARFRLLYVFPLIALRPRRTRHCNLPPLPPPH